MFKSYNPDDQSIRDRHQMLIGSIGPRPIALTTSINTKNELNLAPFSFHNILSSNPPIIGISPALSGRTGLAKDTLNNILSTKIFTVSIVNYDMVDRMNLCAVEYDSSVNEFEVAGFKEAPSKIVSTPGVSESPVILECKLDNYIKLGSKPASGNLILGKVVQIHINTSVIDKNNQIDPHKMDQVSRLGLNWYSRANLGLFDLGTPRYKPMGFNNIPSFIKNNDAFTIDLLTKLAYYDSGKELLDYNCSDSISKKELYAKCIESIHSNDLDMAWSIINFLSKSVNE